jgi:CheY-like chemotaxis protein
MEMSRGLLIMNR